MHWLADAALDGILAAAAQLARLVLFVLPVMVGLELARALGWLQVLERRAEPACRWLGIPTALAPALTAGTTLGVILGSGVVIQTARARPFDPRTLNLLFVFVGVFHAMFEETAVVTSLGGSGLIMVATRFAFGLAAALAYRSWLARRGWRGAESPTPVAAGPGRLPEAATPGD